MATYNCSNGECIEIANVSCRATQADVGYGCGCERAGQDRRCCIGPTGVTGPAGATGATGATGPIGPTGPAAPAALSDYALVYNAGAQTVPAGGAVSFDSNGTVRGAIAHTANTSDILLGAAGDYEITVGGADEGFAVYLNGVPAPAGRSGEIILTAPAGARLSLVNTSGAEISLPEDRAGNISMVIKRLA